jgi:hypothetical protein
LANLKTISNGITKSLGLKYLPVGVRLYKNQGITPANIPFTEDSLKSYCQTSAALIAPNTSFQEMPRAAIKKGSSTFSDSQSLLPGV